MVLGIIFAAVVNIAVIIWFFDRLKDFRSASKENMKEYEKLKTDLTVSAVVMGIVLLFTGAVIFLAWLFSTAITLM